MLACLLCREYNVLIEMQPETILKTSITVHDRQYFVALTSALKPTHEIQPLSDYNSFDFSEVAHI